MSGLKQGFICSRIVKIIYNIKKKKKKKKQNKNRNKVRKSKNDRN